MDGILNVLKPAGMTSFDVIAFLRRVYHQKKIGHGGTLDPMAAGVLPVFLGKATRLIEYAPIHQKTYVGEFLMGFSTDTEDVTGTITKRSPVITDTDVWKKACESFVGDIMQVPSSYSAIRIRGKRAYDLAREGEKVEIPARPVHIYSLDVLEINPPSLRIRVTCSSGTYIRALGRDIGEKAGCPLTMSFLLRTDMGPFSIEKAHTLEEIEKAPETSIVEDLRPILKGMAECVLSESQSAGFLQGMRIVTRLPDAPQTAVYSQTGRFLGIGEMIKGVLHPRKVFNNQ
jgi:tRNA pseudouridine55 synthase